MPGIKQKIKQLISPSIMIVDDDTEFACSLGEMLRDVLKRRLNINIINDIQYVIPAIEMDGAPKVMIIDFHLGRQNAMTLLNELATYPDTLGIPKIILSASGRKLDRADLTQYGVYNVYDKRNYKVMDLVEELNQILKWVLT